ncbi:NifB/NifX family molybdenum-iron cluster-binding protein [Yersinia enterocolitica]|uniref:Dinitrogenase iron-molybdenum cofactor n=2 Tax=Yersinia TaxID=629 RepID=A0AAD2V191_YEREN|nr:MULTISPECIES: NifB/NifX family molybdenum-iron cluster-binding protein [Yersinia]EKN6067037.1 dinitrogenase iron-molybdenum cofactor [Yersinia enterocolitica]ELI8102972.1 dinitrogenase iron-molybdenum cofactor [Yersinia enterocolitica]ELI8126917.1 dinitrogenase iron-molybdenum cofactor [Yersinia enterocolitica]ELW8946939.1 dinitrogenase iron-molybdenum cofactor [Yersinia enterocolitica]CNK89736.1 Dinitrogenase iron-molybdenum cofactor [Yersinia aleksiciae]
MITVVPMNEDRVANHFAKANYLVFLDEQGVEINRVDNPALSANCAGKKKMIDLLVEQQVNQVVVRNIGEQMLGKLLARQFAVYQTDCGSRLLRELSDPIASGLVPLSQSNQGRQSLNHDAKNKSDGCCCASEGKAPEKNNCQSAIQHQRRKGHCCHS